MNPIIVYGGIAVIIILLAVAIFLLGRKRKGARQIVEAREEAAAIMARAKEDGEKIKREAGIEAREKDLSRQAEFDAHNREKQRKINETERRLVNKEENLERRLQSLERREREFSQKENRLFEKEKDIEKLEQKTTEIQAKAVEELEHISGLTLEEAKAMLIKKIEDEAKLEAIATVRKVEEETREKANALAREIITNAIQRSAAEHVVESTVSVVDLPSDDMKGRIIGREGRNIRALETATGVDLIIDDTPDAVTLSAFDPVRREIARVALTKLVLDGRIHPTRIEEVVEKARHEVDASIKTAGEQAAIEAGCPGLHPEILKTMGRLKYRTSYGQNQLKHAVESAFIAAMIAEEIGADVNVSRRGALLHDLGKAIDHEIEGTHAALGGELARRYNVSPAVVHCIEAHHEEIEVETTEAVIVQIADAISGSRPGARRETLELYIKRLEALEGIANSFKGVEKSFAIQAGREIRIIVKPEEIDDMDSMRLARDVSKKIEESLEYPGQIKVTVVRETRASEYAR